MLTIRKEQLRILSQRFISQFEEQMLEHLNRFFPSCRRAGDEANLLLIRRGIEGASRYRIVRRQDVCKYIDLMVILGEKYAENPELPWVGQILANPLLGTAKMAKLVNEAMKHLQNQGASSRRAERN
jgi:hypothetical protein